MNVKYLTQTAAAAAAPVVMFGPLAKASPRLTSYHVTGDHANTLVNVWTATTLVSTLDATCAGSQRVLTIPSTVGWSTDRVLVVRANGTMEWHLVASVQAGVSITTTTDLAAAFASGDKAYQMALVATFPCAVATVSNYAGEAGLVGAALHKPLVLGLVTATGTGNIIHAATVVYTDGK